MKNPRLRQLIAILLMIAIIGLGYLYMVFQTPTDYLKSPVDTDITFPLSEDD